MYRQREYLTLNVFCRSKHCNPNCYNIRFRSTEPLRFFEANRPNSTGEMCNFKPTKLIVDFVLAQLPTKARRRLHIQHSISFSYIFDLHKFAWDCCTGLKSLFIKMNNKRTCLKTLQYDGSFSNEVHFYQLFNGIKQFEISTLASLILKVVKYDLFLHF